MCDDGDVKGYGGEHGWIYAQVFFANVGFQVLTSIGIGYNIIG